MTLTEYIDILTDLEYKLAKEMFKDNGDVSIDVINAKTGKSPQIKIAKDKDTGKIKKILIA